MRVRCVTWRFVEENTSWWLDFELVEHFGVEEREDDHFLERSDMSVETTNTVEVDLQR